MIVGLPGNAPLAALPGRLGTSPDIGAFRPALADPIVVGNLRRLAERAGLVENTDLLETVERGISRRALIAVKLPRAPLGADAAIQPPPPKPAPAAPFARMSATQRIALLLERTPSHLGPDMAAAFRQMVTAEALAGIAAAFAVLLAAQFVGVGEIADAALAWWAYTQAGLSGVYGLYEALRAVVAAVRAPDETTFNEAVIHFAAGLSVLGLALLTAVVTRAARKSAGNAGNDAADVANSSADRTPPAPRRRAIAGTSTARPAEPPIYVLGRQADTAIAKDWPSHSILNIPDWTIAKNDAFVQTIIDQRATVYLGSPQTEATLWDSVNNRMTVFARELGQLRNAGYKQVGDYMYPPPNY